MLREELIDKVRGILDKRGFAVSDRIDLRGVSFDIVARRDEQIVLIKVLLNVDALKKETSAELRAVATGLDASPIVIAVSSSAGKLERGVAYSRFGVPILSLETFSDFLLEGVPPYVFAAPGGLYVRIDGDALERRRRAKRVSIGTLADIAGVSRRAIKMYETGMGTTIDVGLKIEEFLGAPVLLPVNPLSYSKEVEDALVAFSEFEEFERDIFEKLHELGFGVLPTVKCPFEALTRDKRTIWVTGVTSSSNDLARKSALMANISKVVRKDSVFFVERTLKYSISGTPIIEKKELKKIKEPEKVIELIDERKERRKE